MCVMATKPGSIVALVFTMLGMSSGIQQRFSSKKEPPHSVAPKGWLPLSMRANANATWWPSIFKKSQTSSTPDELKDSAEIVDISIYYEAMCPYCQVLLKTSVAQIWNDTEMQARVNISLVPYGNAMTISAKDVSAGYKYWHSEYANKEYKSVYMCQHGSEECFGNMIHACSIETLKTPEVYMPFILCIEGHDDSGIEKSSYECAKELKVDIDIIHKCVTSSKGNELLSKLGEKTEESEHEYVPWVVVGGVHSEQSEMDGEGKEGGGLLKEVCSQLAEPKPSLC